MPEHASPKPLVVCAEPYSPRPLAWLAERAELVQAGPDELPALLPRAEGLLVRTYTQIDRALLDAAPELRVIGRGGVALDNFDLPLCRERGVAVVHAPGANASAVAEYVFALLFDALRPRLFLDRALDLEGWETLRGELIAPRQLEDLTLGVYGMGRIGRRVSRVATAFNMKALYHDVLDIPEDQRFGAEPVGREELLEHGDVVTIHVDDRPGNAHLVNAEAFGRMKRDVVFLNCARGLIVDPAAAAEFFKANPGAVGLFDVHEPEPPGPDHPLCGLPNVHLAPHIAAATERAKENMSWVVRDVWRVLCGQTPEHPAPMS